MMRTPITITSEVTLELPYPGNEISKNHMWNGGDRRKGLTKTAIDWKATISEWLLHFPFYHMQRYIMLPVTVEIRARFVDEQHRPDVQNLSELVVDAVAEAINVNDKHFEVVTKSPEMGVVEPVVIVTVRIRMEV